jgi:hypothetical protein
LPKILAQLEVVAVEVRYYDIRRRIAGAAAGHALFDGIENFSTEPMRALTIGMCLSIVEVVRLVEPGARLVGIHHAHLSQCRLPDGRAPR